MYRSSHVWRTTSWHMRVSVFETRYLDAQGLSKPFYQTACVVIAAILCLVPWGVLLKARHILAEILCHSEMIDFDPIAARHDRVAPHLCSGLMRALTGIILIIGRKMKKKDQRGPFRIRTKTTAQTSRPGDLLHILRQSQRFAVLLEPSRLTTGDRLVISEVYHFCCTPGANAPMYSFTSWARRRCTRVQRIQ